LERRSVGRACAVVALTPDVEAAMRGAHPEGIRGILRVIPYGISLNDYAASWGDRNGRRALGVGIVAPVKRWEIAAAALRGSGMVLRIAGPVVDPAYARRVRASGDRVEFLGEVDESRLRNLYSESDLLVHPSRVEVLPRAVLEAASSSLPVVGSSVVGQALRTSEAGLSAPAGADDAELTRFLQGAVGRLAQDPALRRRMGEAGRALAESTYSWDRVVAAHLALYREADSSAV
jgi:glycosyltransferase involved in cell wall biosynthesis